MFYAAVSSDHYSAVCCRDDSAQNQSGTHLIRIHQERISADTAHTRDVLVVSVEGVGRDEVESDDVYQTYSARIL